MKVTLNKLLVAKLEEIIVIKDIRSKLDESFQQYIMLRKLQSNEKTRANAVIVILCRNRDLKEISKTLLNFENKFNRKFKYPYVFLNDFSFDDNFKENISK